jgi:phosphoribosylanthranilate isomerase
MPRIRLVISGIASLDEARAAVAAGADAIGLDSAAFPTGGLAGSDLLAEIALALPPTVTPILLTQALTAGTIAQQVDAAAATAVQIMRPLPTSEYPGLKRIIRGRKIIQSVRVDSPQALELALSYAEWADALHLDPVKTAQLPLCRQIAADSSLPIFLRVPDPDLVGWFLAAFRPFAIELSSNESNGRVDVLAIEKLVVALS